MNRRLPNPWMSLACVAVLIGLLLPTASDAGETSVWSGGGKVTVGSGKSVVETRNVGAFQAIDLSGSMDLRVTQAAAEAVRVKADDNLVALIETVVENSPQGPVLKVRWKKGESIRMRGTPVVEIDAVKLQALTSRGSGDVMVGSLRTPALAVTLAGSGDAKFDALEADDVTVRVAGSGDVSARGNARRLNVSIAGSGDLSLGGLHADDVSVDIAGSGDAVVHARSTLKVSIAGSGDVVYSGSPVVTQRIAGSGSVARR